MSTLALLDRLHARGVSLAVNGDRLAFDAPRGVLTEGDLIALKEHKPALLPLLRLRQAAAARTITGANGVLVQVDRELSRLWAEARDAHPDCVVTIEGAIYPRTFTGCLSDPARFIESGEPNHSETNFETKTSADGPVYLSDAATLESAAY